MFKPFSWMFKIDNFKEHFKYLFLILFKFFIPAICLSCVILFCKTLPPLWGYVCSILSILLFIAPFFCIQGYFWELTSQIISRDFDVTGAGDTVTAVYTLALACGAEPVYAAIIGNIAAGIVVKQFGCATTSIDEILDSVPERIVLEI